MSDILTKRQLEQQLAIHRNGQLRAPVRARAEARILNSHATVGVELDRLVGVVAKLVEEAKQLSPGYVQVSP